MARKPANAEPDFETTLSQLETIVTKLESGELLLEDALKEFENGIKLAQLGQERLRGGGLRGGAAHAGMGVDIGGGGCVFVVAFSGGLLVEVDVVGVAAAGHGDVGGAPVGQPRLDPQ